MSTRPAAFTAATSVVWSFEFTAFWMMFFDGYIGAPPTLTVFSDIVAAETERGRAGGEGDNRCSGDQDETLGHEGLHILTLKVGIDACRRTTGRRDDRVITSRYGGLRRGFQPALTAA